MTTEPEKPSAKAEAHGEQKPVPPVPPTLPGTHRATPADEDMRFAPPTARTTPPQTATPVEPPATTPQRHIPADADAEVEIPTSRVKIYTPPEERYPPIRPPRELPPEIEQSPNLYPQKQPTPPAKKKGNRVLSVLVILFTLLITGGIVGYAVFIFQNPYSSLNPLAPPTPFPEVITATFLPPTEAPAPTVTTAPTQGAATDVPATAVALALPVTEPATSGLSLDLDTKTPLPMSTNVAQAPGQGSFITLVPSPQGQAITDTTIAIIFPFQLLEPPGIIYAPNGNGRACEWSSIAGTVVGLNGEPRNGLRMRFINQITLEENTVFTGSSATFGDGGFEFVISTAPQVNGYFVQVFSEADVPVSQQLTVVTSDRCDQNVAVINFEQTAPY
ncbi:MAG: hypothetical protein AAF787_01955 [Chloroflexota bacterium]